MTFTAQDRAREIGIRIALGAKSGKVLWGTLKSGLVQIGAGVALGMGLAVLMASWVPAVRAVKTNPVTALQHE